MSEMIKKSLVGGIFFKKRMQKIHISTGLHFHYALEGAIIMQLLNTKSATLGATFRILQNT